MKLSRLLVTGGLLGLLLAPSSAMVPFEFESADKSAVAKPAQVASINVLKTARSFMGIPYVWGGTTAKGFDCSGFVQEVLRVNGFKVPRLADVQFAKSKKVKYNELQPGDMVFFSTYLPGASHCGFYLGNGEFIHASSAGKKVIVSQMRDGYYRNRFVGGGRPQAWPGQS